MHCAPLTASVRQPVRCLDLSSGGGVARLRGPTGELQLIDGAATTFFEKSGPARLTLTRIDGDREDVATIDIAVTPRRPVEPPIGVALRVAKGEAPSVAHEVFDALPIGGSEVYERRWPAADGFRIRRIRLENMASKGLAGLRFQVVDDGAAALFRFSLRATDERAYLKARIILEHEPAPADGRVGDTLWLDADGLWTLPSAPDPAAETVVLVDPGGVVVARAPIGGNTTLRDGLYRLSVDRAAGGLRLMLRRNILAESD